MSTAIAVRAAATDVLAGVLTLVTLTVLPPVLAYEDEDAVRLTNGTIYGLCLVHHLAPARPGGASGPATSCSPPSSPTSTTR